jgi:hypothetical protein
MGQGPKTVGISINPITPETGKPYIIVMVESTLLGGRKLSAK